MHRVYNFNPGPAALPEEVLRQVQEELLDWHGHGMSIMEMSHRTPVFMDLTQSIENDLRDLMAIPPQYKVLFMQGGARGQFAAIPLNLLLKNPKADYVDTGIWSKVAFEEARKYGDINLVISSEDSGYTTIPDQNQWQCRNDAAYLHYVDNETVNGVEFPFTPTSNVPLISDMSSNILSRVIDVSRFGLIYAGSQKNMGPAGLTVVILHEDFIKEAQASTPSVLNYNLQNKNHSLYHTPPTFVWYCIGLVLQWLKRQGGLAAMEIVNARKAKKLYDFIDSNEFYINSVNPKYRSRMNVVFKLHNENLNDLFIRESEKVELIGLKGHSLVGGMRASLFNTVPEKAVDQLIDFMKTFAQHHG